MQDMKMRHDTEGWKLREKLLLNVIETFYSAGKCTLSFFLLVLLYLLAYLFIYVHCYLIW